jgi:hypothetical protein
MSDWLSKIRNSESLKNMVPTGQMVTATKIMFLTLESSDRFFRGWSADLAMRAPMTPNQVFQITITTNIIHKEELDLLSLLSNEFGFDYYIDTSTPQTIIRCFKK